MSNGIVFTHDEMHYVQCVLYPRNCKGILSLINRFHKYTLKSAVEDAYKKGYITNYFPKYEIEPDTIVIDTGPRVDGPHYNMYVMPDGLIGLIVPTNLLPAEQQPH